MNEAMVSTAVSQAMQLDAFWTMLASHACPATQLALAGTARMARDAVVQCAPCTKMTVQVSPGPSPDTLGLLRNTGRTLPATVAINNNTEPPSPLGANHIARLSMHQLRCGAVTSLELGGGTWLVDTALLADICAALPVLTKLVLSNVTTPTHLPAPAAHAPAWPSLRTLVVTISNTIASDRPEAIAHLLAALGVRAGGGVINLTFRGLTHAAHVVHNAMVPMLTGNQMQALRKLHLPGMRLGQWGANQVGGALIRHAPALEHLKLDGMRWLHGDQGTSALCVPWRILEVQHLDVGCLGRLPLGCLPGQPPLILRVMRTLRCSYRDGTPHFTPPPPASSSRRVVQLECTHTTYRDCISSYGYRDHMLRVLTLTTTGLSNLILDGIDSADDIKDLVDLSATGITITIDGPNDAGVCMGLGELAGLHDLPWVTKVELRAGAHDKLSWGRVDARLLASLPAHVTEVCLSDKPGIEVVSRMCVLVSGLPQRQAHPLRLCVPGVEGWFEAAESAMTAAGITTPGVVGVPDTEVL